MATLGRLADSLAALDQRHEVVFGGDIYSYLDMPGGSVVGPRGLFAPAGQEGVLGMEPQELHPYRSRGLTVMELGQLVRDAVGSVHVNSSVFPVGPGTPRAASSAYWTADRDTPVYATRRLTGGYCDRLAILDVVEGDGRAVAITHDIHEYLDAAARRGAGLR